MTPDPTARPRADGSPDLNAPLPPANDPGGAHAKGYSADPDPTAPPVPDPIPLATAPRGATVHVPERDDGVQPTGRKDPEPYNPNERASGVR